MITAASTEPHEVRLALVLNGGVSLAIWMGGVVGEIDALRGSNAPDDKAAGQSFWHSLLGALGLWVVVDVVAGTSAGGINGALLATAIARESPLPPLRETWITLARYEKELLIKGRAAETRSILDGGFFLRKVRETVAAIGQDGATGPPPSDVTLFMTGTALVGDQSEYVDEDGQRFTATDHRIRFTFRRNAERNDFRDDRDEQQASRRLARAARATASFPAAFEPIYVNNTGVATVPPESPLDEAPEGPDMSEITGLEASRWVIDGGVLDNEPFRPVLAEIAGRPVGGPVDRVIAYIVPAFGETVPDPPSDAVTPAPGVLRSVPAAFSLPRGMSSLDDLERLEKLAETANTDRETRKRFLAKALSGELGAPNPALFQMYRERRRDATAWEMRKLVRERAGYAGVYLRTIPESGQGGTCDLPWLPRAPDSPVGENGRWAWGVSAASRFLRGLLGIVRDGLDSGSLPPERQRDIAGIVGELWASVERLQTIEASLADQLALALSVEEVYSRTDEEVNALAVPRFEEGIADGEAAAGGTLAEIVWAAATTVVEKRALPVGWVTLEGEAGARQLLQRFLWAEVYERVAAAPEYAPTPRFRFHRFGLNPRTWFLDSTLVFTSKLMGIQVHHFGAFFKDEWRAHDWTWGRLDGASHLIAMLVTRESLARSGASDRLAELTEETVEMRDALERLRQATARGDDDVAEDQVRRVRALLVRSRHAVILREELSTIEEHWDGEKPDALVAATRGSVPDDDALRAAWTAICHNLGETSALGLTSGGAGREILGWSVASSLRALSLDDAVPRKLGRVLRMLALGVRGMTSTSWVGTVVRIAVIAVTLTFLVLAAWAPIEVLDGAIPRVLFGWLGGLLTPLALWLLPGRFRSAGRLTFRSVPRLVGLVRGRVGKNGRSGS